jgi:hypothetical protein
MTKKFPAHDDREHSRDKDTDTDTNTDTDIDTDTDTDTDTLFGSAKTEFKLKLVWLWSSLGVLRCGNALILQNYRPPMAVRMYGDGHGHEH